MVTGLDEEKKVVSCVIAYHFTCGAAVSLPPSYQRRDSGMASSDSSVEHLDNNLVKSLDRAASFRLFVSIRFAAVRSKTLHYSGYPWCPDRFKHGEQASAPHSARTGTPHTVVSCSQQTPYFLRYGAKG
jgi:hypothetical protein